ncbi:ABC transporter ATP-binding protein [Peribacillus kribbensis]|uniref:ABC transporter ATP-binding protein n=1 Tax=Peribacillus kribbensis TaxID=356658 RepID=UPI000412AA89|nr:ABC transporter ATP-binding protein [Peribacillus kribbensis]
MSVSIRSVSKTFIKGRQEEVKALENINLEIKQGDFVTIIGPSGCGKSTLLKILAGLDRQYEGSVQIGGRPLHGPGIKQGFIFQEHRLFPWLNVEKNIAADLPLSDREVRKKVDDLLETVRLKGFEKAYPSELSGGMAQRTAIARALLREPDVLLLDEPFGALDAFTRTHLQDVLLTIWEKKRTTMILVTHDIDESIYLGNRILIMTQRPGTISRSIPVDLPYPRKKSELPFQQIRQKVMIELESAGLFSEKMVKG